MELLVLWLALTLICSRCVTGAVMAVALLVAAFSLVAYREHNPADGFYLSYLKSREAVTLPPSAVIVFKAYEGTPDFSASSNCYALIEVDTQTYSSLALRLRPSHRRRPGVYAVDRRLTDTYPGKFSILGWECYQTNGFVLYWGLLTDGRTLFINSHGM